MEYEACRALLESRLKPERYVHSLGVAETAGKLARRFGVDEAKARMAGLLHDNAREFPVTSMLEEARRRAIPVTPLDMAMPLLLHAPLGAYRLKELYGIEDAAIAQAVARHTVGGAGMTPLDKIIYFADMIEPGRDYPGVSKLRKLAEEAPLDKILLAAFSESIAFVLQKGQLIHPDTVTARNEILLAGMQA